MKKMNQSPQLALLFATNMFGVIEAPLIKKINRFLKKPTYDNWDDISTIIIDGSGKMKTIWNAVIAIDPCFPRVGRKTNLAGDVVQEWSYIPTPKEVVQAINACVFVSKSSTN